MFLVAWRNVYVVSIALRFFFALANSYIHPDEHFQSLEPLAGPIFGYATNVPWEFSGSDPARSIAPLLAVYWAPMKMAHWIGLGPMQTWYVVRLVVMLVSWMATDWLLYRMLPTKQERIKALFFVLTSYVTMVFQAHTFSNSIETILVLAVVYLINELRFLKRVAKNQYSAVEIARIGMGIGVICALGLFNRVTFPAYVVVPALFLVPAVFKWKYLLPCLVCSFGIAGAALVVVDTAYYRHISVSDVLLSSLSFSNLVITPWNNLKYNSQIANLSVHGLHPYYTHVAANLPQILGPGLAFLFGRGSNKYWKTTPFLAAAGGITLLSIVPHQELRFLVPTVPLLCACFDLTVFDSFAGKNINLVNTFLSLWLVFNGIMALVMGVFHQGGVVPALDYLYNSNLMSNGSSIIWWRTYLMPTWMLGDTTNSTQFVTLSREKYQFKVDSSKKNRLIDAMGMLHENLQLVLAAAKEAPGTVYLVIPVASFNKFFNVTDYEGVWSYSYHLPLDHLDFSDLASMQPGLGIYRLLV